MQVIGKLIRPEDLDLSGRTRLRDAVRGIILRECELLMVFSPKNGDFKFPGGGIESGETHEEALVREIREECGTKVIAVRGAYGKMVTYGPASDADYDVFKMRSHYYLCDVEPTLGEQNLDQYEEDLEYTPTWVTIDDAIQKNSALLNSPTANPPPWTKRDTLVLEHLRKMLDS